MTWRPMLAVRQSMSLLLPALLLAGCGGATTPTAPRSAPSATTTSTAPTPSAEATSAAGELDVCALLTVVEATEVAKTAVQAGTQRTGLTGARTCSFDLEAGTTASVTVAVKQGRDYFDFLSGQGGKQPVAGVGDEAFTCEGCGGSNLVVFAEGSSLLVRVTRPTGMTPPTLEDLVALAALVVSRLKR